MESKNSGIAKRIIGKDLIRYFILIYWTVFWLLNMVDKVIGGAHFLFVGKDRFAQIQRFFDSIGLGEPIVANIALIITAGLETSAFVFFSGALYHFAKKNIDAARSWFFIGIALTIITYTYFTVGDQVFGDRFTLLEHTIFWIILIFSWVIYKYNSLADERVMKFTMSKALKTGLLIGAILTVITSYSIVNFANDTYANKTNPLQGEEVVEGVYKFDVPFLGDKITIENTLKAFEKNHTDLKVNYMYTGPDELNSKKKTHMLLYLFTEKR